MYSLAACGSWLTEGFVYRWVAGTAELQLKLNRQCHARDP